MNYWEGKMSKTTNYEISKKLAEIGFSRQAFWVWISKNCCAPYQTDYDGFLSYDLETLLDVLPKKMTNKYGKEFTLEISFDVSNWIYYIDKNDYIFLSENYIHGQMESEKNESLADTAGRFITLLHEKNLIKF
jgi:hypothetical protein